MHMKPDNTLCWWRDIWKLNAPPRTRLFFWCILKDIVPMGEHLTHRAVYGPSWFSFCKVASESTEHLFLHCPASRALWHNLSSSIGFAGTWDGVDIQSSWADWRCRHLDSKFMNLPLIVAWHIWLDRNRYIFENLAICWPRTKANIISSYLELLDASPPRIRTVQPPPIVDKSAPWAFFDGAANHIGCGGGFMLHINEHHCFKVKMGFGVGSNNYAELMALHNLLHFSLEH